MGTSKAYGGAPSGLVPSWVEDTAPGAIPSGVDVPAVPGDGQPSAPIPASVPDTSMSGSLSAAKSNFTRFSRTGDVGSLRRAVSQYVRQGAGSASKAAKRMGTSRGVGSNLLGLIRDIERDGASQALLARLNRSDLVGRPASEVFVLLADVICPPGGRVDEAIARQALMDTIADLAEAGDVDFDDLSAEHLSEFFLDYVVHTVEGRVLADIGTHAIDLPQDVHDVEAIQQQLHDFVRGCVHGRLNQQLNGVAQKTDEQIQATVESIYEAAFELVSATAEDVE